MSSPRGHRGNLGRFLALGLAFGAAGLTAGCFQPLYGNGSLDAAGAPPPIRTALASVEVPEIEAPERHARSPARGRGAQRADFRPDRRLRPVAARLFAENQPQGQPPERDRGHHDRAPGQEIYGIDATYSLIEIATKKVVLTGRAFSRASYDIPGQQQRFARARGERDAQNRSSTIIAEQIKSRLASYFVTGG